MTTAKDMIDEAIKRLNEITPKLKPYVLFCHPSKAEEIRSCINDMVQVIQNPAMKKDEACLIKRADIDGVLEHFEPIVFRFEGEETEGE